MSEGRIQLDFGTLNPIQRHVSEEFRKGKRFVAMITGRQGGKSFYGARWLISQIATGRGKNKLSIVAAPTFRYARIAQRKLEEVFKSDPRLWKAIKHIKQPIPTYELPDGHIIEVHSVDDPDSVRGLTVDFVWFDEAAVAAGDAFDIMIPTLLASGGSMLLTTTPRGRSNWIYKKIYLKSIPPGEDGHDDALYSPYYATVFGSTWENVDNLTHEAVQLMEEQYGKGSRFAAQEIEGTFVTYDGLVFQWDEDINFLTPGEMPDLKDFDHIIGGLDFGWKDPNAAVVLGYKDGLWYALDGQYETQQSMDDLANQLTVFGERYGVKVWYADSARPDSIAELHSRGIPAVAVKKPTLEDSIRMMSTFANRNRFKVSHRVPWLKDEFQTYQYIEVGRKGQQTPLDKNNHMLDACLVEDTLVATETGVKKISEVGVGERVWTRNGLRRVLGAGLTGRQSPVYEIAMTNGKTLVGTFHHPVFVKERQKFVSIGELSTGDTLIQITPALEGIGNRKTLPRLPGLITSTGKSIKTLWGRLWKAATSTTGIKIPRITPLRTLSVCIRQTTTSFMGTRCPNGERSGCGTGFQLSNRRPRAGTRPPKESSGTGNTLSSLTLGSTKGKRQSATNAEKSLLPEVATTGFVQTPVSLHGVGQQALTMWRKLAWFVERSLYPTNTPRLTIAHVSAPPRLVGHKDVYNLTVEGSPEFFANGVLVHNCRYALHMYRWLWANKFDYTTPSEGEDMGDRYTPWGELKKDWRRGRNRVSNSPAGLWGN